MRLLRNIGDFVTHHTFVFVIFLLLFVVSFCGVLYTVNFLQNTMYGDYQRSEDDRAFVVRTNDSLLTEKLTTLLEEKQSQLQHVYCVIEQNDDLIFADFYGNRYNRAGASIGSWFSEEDIASGAKKIILPNYQYIYSSSDSEPDSLLSVGDVFYVGSTAYTAIGMGLLDSGYQIPYNSAEDTSVFCKTIVVLNEIKNQKAINDFADYLNGLFGGNVVAVPTKIQQTSFVATHPTETILVTGIMFVSVFSLAHIYLYILDVRKKEIAVCRISGQTIASATFFYYAEVVLLSSVAYLFAVFLTKFCILLPLKSEGALFNDTLNFAAVSAVFGITIVLCSAVFLPAIIHAVRKPPAEALSDAQTT